MERALDDLELLARADAAGIDVAVDLADELVGSEELVGDADHQIAALHGVDILPRIIRERLAREDDLLVGLLDELAGDGGVGRAELAGNQRGVEDAAALEQFAFVEMTLAFGDGLD